MEFKDTPIWAEVQPIVERPLEGVVKRITATLHTEAFDDPLRYITLKEVRRDYINLIGEYVKIKVKMPLGYYMFDFYPMRENLEVTLKTEIINLYKKDDEDECYEVRYKAVFDTENGPNYEGTIYKTLDKETANNKDILEIELDLIPKAVEVLRVKTTLGTPPIYRGITQKQLITQLLTYHSSLVTIEGSQAIEGVDIVEPDNTAVKYQVAIPTGTPIATIPTLLQEKAGGVYSNGLGTFLQYYKEKHLWFVYPLNDHRRYLSTQIDKDVAIIYAAPTKLVDALTSTYSYESGVLKIVAAVDKAMNDTADKDQMNAGVGYRIADANAMMKKPLKVEGAKGITSRANLNIEVAARERNDGLNYAPRVKPSANPYKFSSAVSHRNSVHVLVMWNYCEDTLIYPGMPCKFVFMNGEEMEELVGTIVDVQTREVNTGNPFSSTTFSSSAAITMSLERQGIGTDALLGELSNIMSI